MDKKFTDWLKDVKQNGIPEQQAKALAESEAKKKQEEERIKEQKRRDDDTLLLCIIACM